MTMFQADIDYDPCNISRAEESALDRREGIYESLVDKEHRYYPLSL